jgi:Orotidine 5'-phosphate decarboxylase / HUMPS family
VKQAEATRLQPRDRLIVALDLPSVEAAQAMVSRLGDAASFYKIGYQLAFAGGLAYAQTLAGAGKRVFLDLKLHDIGNTVAQGVKSVRISLRWPIQFFRFCKGLLTAWNNILCMAGTLNLFSPAFLLNDSAPPCGQARRC